MGIINSSASRHQTGNINKSGRGAEARGTGGSTSLLKGVRWAATFQFPADLGEGKLSRSRQGVDLHVTAIPGPTQGLRGFS